MPAVKSTVIAVRFCDVLETRRKGCINMEIPSLKVSYVGCLEMPRDPVWAALSVIE